MPPLGAIFGASLQDGFLFTWAEGVKTMNKPPILPKESLFPIASLRSAEATTAQVTLEVLNPRGEIPPPPTLGIRPRLTNLAGKKIGLCDNGKFGASSFLDAIETMLKQKYPAATILRLPKPAAQTITLTKGWYPEVAAQVDGFIFATGD
jgi:hypothetical protein